MTITNIQVRTIKNKGALLGSATITIDDEFVIHDITIINGKKGKFISMPSKKLGDDRFIDIAHPIKPGTRKKIQDAVLEKYESVLKSEEEPAE